MRQEVVVIVAPFKNCLAVHFCSPKKLQGEDCNLWFPLTKTTDVNQLDFSEIELIMQINHVAHNVTSIKKKLNSGLSADYQIIFNEFDHSNLSPDSIW